MPYTRITICTLFFETDKPCDLSKETCLFNVKTDPCELVNRAADEPQILKDMLKALSKYKPVEPLNRARDPRANPKFWNYTWTNWMDYV